MDGLFLRHGVLLHREGVPSPEGSGPRLVRFVHLLVHNVAHVFFLFEVPHFLFFSRRWIAVLLSLALIGAVTFFNMYTRFTVRIRRVSEV